MRRLIPAVRDRSALGLWALATLAVAWFSIVVIRVIPHDGPWPDFLARWNRWDADRFLWLAKYGYDGGPPGYYDDPEEWPAFFPGYPLAVRLVGLVFSDLRAAGLVVSLLAGLVAAVALTRLANDSSSLPRTFRRPSGRTPTVSDRRRDAPAETSGPHPSYTSDPANPSSDAEEFRGPHGSHPDTPADRHDDWPQDAHDRDSHPGDPRFIGDPLSTDGAHRAKAAHSPIGRAASSDPDLTHGSRFTADQGFANDSGVVGDPAAAPSFLGPSRADGSPRASVGTAATAVKVAEAGRDVLRGAGPGFYAVLALVVSPAAVFLFAAYSEALFLALAVPAWLLAKRGRWELAVLCAAGASVVRITGLFLAVALIVEFLVGENGRKGPRGWRPAPYLVVPFLSIAGYMAYQWARTGDWLAWQHAQKAGWNRTLVSPLQSFQTTWDAAFNIDNEWSNAFRVEIAAAFVGVLLVGWLLYQFQWAEAVYVGTQLAALMVSQYYLSIGRATLVWFPLWIALGHLAYRHRKAYFVYVALALPVMATFVLSFTQGQWTG